MKVRFFYTMMCLISLFIIVPSVNLFAATNELQQGIINVKGTITDITGEPLPGVSVVVKGTTTGTMTDVDGHYSINVPNNQSILVISFVGFKPQEHNVGNRTTIDCVLEDALQELDEVVVVGYGVQKKVNMTGSVSSISEKELASRPITNVSSALGGLAAGVVVNQSSGHPSNDGAKIRVRGTGTLNNSDALVIVDGIEGNMDAVNPQDIESISILKDAASSAIYGSRAANGVVLITTKKGAAGKNTISFSSTLSIAKPTKTHEFVTDYASYMKYSNEGAFNMGNVDVFPQSDIDAWTYAKENPNELNEYGYPLWLVYPNTDWGSAAFQTKVIQNYNLSASGGTDKLKYNLSLGYLNNPGIMVNTGIEKYQGRINVESKLTSFLTVGTQTFFSTQKQDIGNVDNAFNYLSQTTPGYYHKPYDGFMQQPSSSSESAMANAVYDWLTRVGGDDKVNRINTTWYAKFDIMKGLNFETKVNYQRRNREKNTYTDPWRKKNFATGVEDPPVSPESMTTKKEYDRDYMVTTDNVLRYNITIDTDHDIAALIGHNEYYFNYNKFTATKKGLIDNELNSFDSANEVTEATGNKYDYGMRSFFGRINYAYKSKYLFEANMRRDGSTRFAKDARWGNFPSFSVGWRISEEDFVGANFKDLFQNFKLKASWGKLGNSITKYGDRNIYYGYMNTYTKDTGIGSNYSFGGNPVIGLIIKDLGNSDLKWESTRVLNFGLEAITLDGRLSVEAEYYDKYTDGILTGMDLIGVLGTKNTPIMNMAEVSNKGFEVTLNWRDNIQDFVYSVGTNISYNKNRVEKYKGSYEAGWTTDASGNRVWTSNIGQAAVTREDGYVIEGREIGEFYVRKLYRGDGTYFDSNGNVNPNGGPTNGMIRTKEDYEWVKAMKAAGYKFSPENKTDKKSELYYGDLLYDDLNGDGTYGDSYDREFTKTSTLPKWSLGVNVSAAYKGFDFSMIWSGNFGAKIYGRRVGINTNRLIQGNEIGLDVAKNHYFYNPDDEADPRTNLNGKWPRLKYGNDAINEAVSEFWIQNGNYFRMKNIQLGYTLPKSITNKIGAGLVRVYVSGENLLTISPFSGIDPETQKMSGYPTMKQMAFGLNVNF